jgi:hypothetical protein
MSGVEVICEPDLSGNRLLSPLPTTASCTIRSPSPQQGFEAIERRYVSKNDASPASSSFRGFL